MVNWKRQVTVGMHFWSSSPMRWSRINEFEDGSNDLSHPVIAKVSGVPVHDKGHWVPRVSVMAKVPGVDLL